jgi:O-antigen ligase
MNPSPSTGGLAAPGTAGPSAPRRHCDGFGGLELVAGFHVASLLVFTAWDLGGETDFARLVISGWGSLAVLITGYACLHRLKRHAPLPSALRWLWPLLLFNALVLASVLNPSFTRSIVGRTAMFVSGGSRPGWPSTARPLLSLAALWQFDAIFLTCFNLLVAVTRRRLLRVLLFIATINALLLAVLGTFQKLASSPGLFFGSVPSPNALFFSSFIYHNHWGAFCLLFTAAALGLVFHYANHAENGGHRHSPAFFGLVATLFLAGSIPLSASRSCTLLVLTLLVGAFLHWMWRLRGRQRAEGRPLLTPVVVTVVVFLLGLGAIYLLGRPVIEARINKTHEQIEEIRLRGDLGSREQLYADTWQMAREKIWFGWGFGSYATVFQMFNRQVSVEGWVPFFAEAHSDWLQLLAEVGLVGTTLIILLAVVPLAASVRPGPPGVLPAYLLAACGLLVVYALVEFPFANPAVMEAFWFVFFWALRYHKLMLSAA